MFSYFRNRAERKRKALYKKGFDAAAGILLVSGSEAIEMLEYQVEYSREWDQYNPFDEGIEAALDLYKSKMD